MITEDYVSFETAKLMKENGFNETTLGYYLDDKGELYFDRFSDDWNSNHVGYISAPTLQMAMKWLRELHKIDIIVTPSMFRGKYNVYIYKDENLCGANFDGATLSPSYEKAYDAAIKYCLENLI